MRRSLTAVLAVGWLIASVSSARAQISDPPLTLLPVLIPGDPIFDDITPAQDAELRRWLEAMQSWKRSEARSFNRLAHDLNGEIVRRHAAPTAPEWLPGYCGGFVSGESEPLDETLSAGCHLLAEITSDPAAQAIRAERDAARRTQEHPTHTSFFTRVHLDGLWTTPTTSYRSYGLLGSHISLVDIGPVQMFGPPGVLLVRVPTGSGTYQMRVGYTWGLSVRLMDLRLLSSTKNATLFVTAAKCWVSSGSSQLTNPSFDIVGFSIARRKPR